MPCPTLQRRTIARAGGSARHQLWTHAAEALLICGDGGCAGKGKGEGKGDGEGEGEDESRGGWMKGEGEQEGESELESKGAGGEYCYVGFRRG